MAEPLSPQRRNEIERAAAMLRRTHEFASASRIEDLLAEIDRLNAAPPAAIQPCPGCGYTVGEQYRKGTL